jgi:uncharacterized protein YheU (UPF0270 family)
MAQFVTVPLQKLDGAVLQSLLEEYASRDGTDYGARELTLDEKVSRLHGQLERGELFIVYDLLSEEWDLIGSDNMAELGL